ncbi:MAG: hypothetical protein ABI647_09985 [Gemmatimonadota bacterium]
MRTLGLAGAVTLVGVLGLSPLVAQARLPETAPATFSMAKDYRAVQLSALKAQRKLLLSFADSMPERLYRDKVTPVQRDFAQQVAHVAGAVGPISSMWIKGVPSKEVPGTAAILNSRAGLKQYINVQYDAAEQLLTSQSDADRDLRVQFFGGAFIPRWQVWDELNQHSIWTAGQIVANFRKNGMAPPAFLFF